MGYEALVSNAVSTQPLMFEHVDEMVGVAGIILLGLAFVVGFYSKKMAGSIGLGACATFLVSLTILGCFSPYAREVRELTDTAAFLDHCVEETLEVEPINHDAQNPALPTWWSLTCEERVKAADGSRVAVRVHRTTTLDVLERLETIVARHSDTNLQLATRTP